MLFDDIVSTLGLIGFFAGVTVLSVVFKNRHSGVSESTEAVRVMFGTELTVTGILLSLLGIIGLITHNLF